MRHVSREISRRSPPENKEGGIVGWKWVMLSMVIAGLGFCVVQWEPGNVGNLRGKIVALTQSLAGLPYQYGGSDIEGFDCSGFVHYVYDCFGIQLPRTAKKQGKMKRQVRFSGARPGDIVVFKIKRSWHTGIFLSSRFFAHAPKRGERIRNEEFNSYWKKHFKWAVRVIDD